MHCYADMEQACKRASIIKQRSQKPMTIRRLSWNVITPNIARIERESKHM